MFKMEGQDWQQENVKKQLLEINGFHIGDLEVLDKFDNETINKVMLVLLEWACYGQGDTGLMMGRQLLSMISKDCLEKHIVDVVKNGFEYEDTWNFERLLEFVTEMIPNCTAEILKINSNSSEPDMIELIEYYTK